MATIASLLRERVTLQVNSVDRIFLAGYVPKLQSEGQVVRFLLDRGFPIPSPAALGKIGQTYVRAIERFAHKHQIPVVRFVKGASKEEQSSEVGRLAKQQSWLPAKKGEFVRPEKLSLDDLPAAFQSTSWGLNFPGDEADGGSPPSNAAPAARNCEGRCNGSPTG